MARPLLNHCLLHTPPGSPRAICPHPSYQPGSFHMLFRKARQSVYESSREIPPISRTLEFFTEDIRQTFGPSHQLLGQLNRLERSSPDFPSQLTSILSTRQYQDLHYLGNLGREDTAWLTEYLDNVCARVPLYYSLLSMHRSSTLLIPLALRILNACVNSKGYAFIGVGYRGRTYLIFPPCSPLLIKSILDRIKPSMKGC